MVTGNISPSAAPDKGHNLQLVPRRQFGFRIQPPRHNRAIAFHRHAYRGQFKPRQEIRDRDLSGDVLLGAVNDNFHTDIIGKDHVPVTILLPIYNPVFNPVPTLVMMPPCQTEVSMATRGATVPDRKNETFWRRRVGNSRYDYLVADGCHRVWYHRDHGTQGEWPLARVPYHMVI